MTGLCRHAGIEDKGLQMNYLFTKLDQYLRNSIGEPRLGISLNVYVCMLQEKGVTWEDMYRPNSDKKYKHLDERLMFLSKGRLIFFRIT